MIFVNGEYTVRVEVGEDDIKITGKREGRSCGLVLEDIDVSKLINFIKCNL